jgi:hypothetical protein
VVAEAEAQKDFLARDPDEAAVYGRGLCRHRNGRSKVGCKVIGKVTDACLFLLPNVPIMTFYAAFTRAPRRGMFSFLCTMIQQLIVHRIS